MRIRVIASAMITLIVVSVGLFQWADYVNSAGAGTIRSLTPPLTPEAIALQAAEELEWQRLKNGGEYYKQLKIVSDYAGHVPTELLDAESVTLPPSTEIVGVEVAGEFCAFVLDSMSNPRYHIVNTMLNMKPISVTYCDLVDCVRVLTDDDSTTIPLHMGGLDVNNQMVLLLDGERFGQSSEGLPLKDHDFVRTTLGDWMNRHPSTKIYVCPEG